TSGSVDFAVLCANGIAIGVTDGNGHFTFHVIPLTGANGGHIVSGHFNHDGRPDLAFTEPLGNNIGIALNTGGTNFTAPRAISVPQPNIGDIEVGNFTADATPDVVVASGSGVTFFNGVGDGTFGLPIALPLNAHPTAIAAADIDLEGLTDIVVGEGNG